LFNPGWLKKTLLAADRHDQGAYGRYSSHNKLKLGMASEQETSRVTNLLDAQILSHTQTGPAQATKEKIAC
jgi:hypothetical protein